MLPGSFTGGHSHERSKDHYGHSHGHRHSHRNRDKEITKTQSSPALGLNTNPVSFESAPLPHVRSKVAASSSLDSMGMTKYGQQQMTVEAGHSNPPVEAQKMGAFVLGETEPERSDKGHKQPARQLWQKGWKASSVTCAVPKLYCPLPAVADSVQSVGETTASISTVLDFPRDRHSSNPVLHCIDLQRHNKEFKSLLSLIDAEGVENVSETAPSLPTRFYHPASASKKVYSDPSSPPSSNQLPAVDLDQTSLQQLLRKSTAAMCTYCGYNDSSSIALDTLSNVLGDFLTNFTKLLQINSIHQRENGGVAFQDVMDLSLHQCGIIGKAALDKYWQKSVKGDLRHLENQAADNLQEYLKIMEPPSSSSTSKQKLPETLDLHPWPTLEPCLESGREEELSLDTIMQQANLDNVIPAKTPDLGGTVVFSQFSDQAIQEDGDSESLTLVMEDGPPRKRLRTISFDQ